MIINEYRTLTSIHQWIHWHSLTFIDGSSMNDHILSTHCHSLMIHWWSSMIINEYVEIVQCVEKTANFVQQKPSYGGRSTKTLVWRSISACLVLLDNIDGAAHQSRCPTSMAPICKWCSSADELNVIPIPSADKGSVVAHFKATSHTYYMHNAYLLDENCSSLPASWGTVAF